MKSLIIASTLAFTSLLAFAPASYADTMTVTTRHNVQPVHRDWHRPHDCYTKTVRAHHHGRVVVEKTRVCR